MSGWIRIAGVAAALVLAATPAVAQRGSIQQGYREFSPPPEGLHAPAPTTDAVVAARGNVLRWRDDERARIGPYSRENEAANALMRTAYDDAREAQRRKRVRDRESVPEPIALPVGPSLRPIGGYFAYFFEAEGAPMMTVLAAIWHDPKSNAGEASSARGLAMLPDTFCGLREVSLADVTYLGPTYTPELAALNRTWLGPRAAPLTLSGSELTFTRTPAGAMFYRYYPDRALAREVEGTVSTLCDIGETGILTCSVSSEEPLGWGFAEAALKIAAEGYLVDPVLRDGGGPSAWRRVCLSTAFRLEN